MSKAEKLRLFIAFDVDPGLLDAIADATSYLKTRWPNARWTPLANQHVTLKFLGWVEAEQREEVATALRDVVVRHGPIRLEPGDYGAFPSDRRARVFWAGFRDPDGALPSLAGDIELALEPLGFESEKRSFTAHLTLARFKVPQRIQADLPAKGPPGGAFEVDRIVLYRSHLSPKGPRYEALETFVLEPRRGRTGPLSGEPNQ